ncbi:hypothetical protein DM02DRAFT_624799 [Periconia macrospinosa]|uniref:Uncharacterized protein n=1 Tax=Periconia macrospinosa TaxID=97972 RepID=A0A2V1E2I8_9PLEO|nr:hypothetical protein DM02DRAFT_624799 [Periconia macrospinosa]
MTSLDGFVQRCPIPMVLGAWISKKFCEGNSDDDYYHESNRKLISIHLIITHNGGDDIGQRSLMGNDIEARDTGAPNSIAQNFHPNDVGASYQAAAVSVSTRRSSGCTGPNATKDECIQSFTSTVEQCDADDKYTKGASMCTQCIDYNVAAGELEFSSPPPPALPERTFEITLNYAEGYRVAEWVLFELAYGSNESQHVYPGGTYPIRFHRQYCEYKNSGDNPRALWCEDKAISCNYFEPKGDDSGLFRLGLAFAKHAEAYMIQSFQASIITAFSLPRVLLLHLRTLLDDLHHASRIEKLKFYLFEDLENQHEEFKKLFICASHAQGAVSITRTPQDLRFPHLAKWDEAHRDAGHGHGPILTR